MSHKAVILRLNELLKPLGFTRQKAVWNRRVGNVVDVIDVQVSKAGDTITVNAGVLDHEVHAKLWGKEAPPFIEEPACTVRARIGELIDSNDRWWSLSKVETATEVAEAVKARVLPFLKCMHTRQAMAEWLVTTQVVRKKYPPPILNLAILKSDLGKNQEACALLADFRGKTVGAWRARFDEVGKRLGCQ
jgi:hypothetical protein